MIDTFFRRARVIARLQSGPLGQYLAELAQTLHQQGYAPASIRGYLSAGDKFGRWLIEQGHSVSEIDETLVEDYIGSLERRVPGTLPKEAEGLTHLTHLLRQHGVVRSRAPTPAPTAADRWLSEYEYYLNQVLGLAPLTQRCYRTIAKRFIEARFGLDAIAWSALSAPEVVEFVYQEARTRTGRGPHRIAAGVRSLLRFLVGQGEIAPSLATAVPKVRQWSQAALPTRLSEEELARVLANETATTPKGLRNRAILLLLARLGLRAQEVTALRLEDIDWRASCVHIRPGKTRQARVLPLTQEVGEALAAYLSQGRPRSTSRVVFLHYRAPFLPFAESSAVGRIAHQALLRAGVAPQPRLGAHTFRHTVASQMVNQGASFKDVADVLGHRSLQTTGLYAKLDLDGLAPIALPWLGGDS